MLLHLRIESQTNSQSSRMLVSCSYRKIIKTKKKRVSLEEAIWCLLVAVICFINILCSLSSFITFHLCLLSALICIYEKISIFKNSTKKEHFHVYVDLTLILKFYGFLDLSEFKCEEKRESLCLYVIFIFS